MNTDCRNRINLAVNAKAFSPVIQEDDRTENKTPKGGN